MPLESATFVNGLVDTNPAHTDPLDQVDSHIRLIKSALRSTFPNFSTALGSSPGAIDLVVMAVSRLNINSANGSITLNGASPDVIIGSTSVLGHLMPSGGIIMWSGAVTNIPSGWVLCDGSHGTPDLRDRFMIGAGGSYGVGSTGGAVSQSVSTSSVGNHSHGVMTGSAGGFSATVQTDTQGSHSHSGTTGSTALTLDQIPSHTHAFNVSSDASGPNHFISSNNTTGYSATTTTAVGGGNGHNHTIGSDGSHLHNVSFSVGEHTHVINGDGQHNHTVTVTTLPPYYALCFIMKT